MYISIYINPAPGPASSSERSGSSLSGMVPASLDPDASLGSLA